MHLLRALPVLALAGCGFGLPDPAPGAVDPSWGYNGEDTLITIEGRHFYPQVEADATGRSGGDVDRTFSVDLLSAEKRMTLPGVTLQSYDRLDAVVPEGLPPGTYDLVVTGPTGATGTLEDAFVVTSTRADRLAVDSERVLYEVNEEATLTIELRDPRNRLVLSDFEVVVQVVGEKGVLPIAFDAGDGNGLEDLTVVEEGQVVVGRLGSDGYASLQIASPVPDTLTVTVSPAEVDSNVADGVFKLLVTPGEIAALGIDLPSEDFVAEAGTPFAVGLSLLDAYGNVVDDAEEDVVLSNACGSWVKGVEVPGATVLDVELVTACAEDHLEVVFGPTGASDPFVVQPGALDHLEVDVSEAEVRAGEPQYAIVTPVDAFGNRVAWPGGTLSFSDSQGGVTGWSCFFGPSTFCSVTSVYADDAVQLTATIDEAYDGVSTAYAVTPADPDALSIALRSSVLVAGQPSRVTVGVQDPWGNTIEPTSVGVDLFTFEDDHGEVECAFDTLRSDGTADWQCTLYVADPSDALGVSLDTVGISARSGAFRVVNGDLASVEVTPSVTRTTAGSTVAFTFEGTDAWGNAYAVHTLPDIEIRDTSGSLTLTGATFDATGTASGSGYFTVAGETEVIVSQSGTDLGWSSAISVEAGTAQDLAITLDEPWVWVDEPVLVAVEVVDTWGNRCDLDTSVTLTSGSGTLSSTTLTVLDGAGSSALTWTEATYGETLNGTSTGGLTGSTAAFAVVRDCGSSGPTAAITFGGYDAALACYDPSSGYGRIVGSMAGSSAGSGTFNLYALSSEEGYTSSATSTLTMDLTSVGVHTLRALAARTDGCGAEVGATAWLGEDDGEPVGPLAITSSASSIDVGSGSTTVGIDGATDCSRDPADGGTLYVRTDRGAISGATSTGAGLAVVLDSAGDASFTLDASAASTGGDANVYAWAASGASRGRLEVTLSGDAARPVVWEQDPRGDVLDLVDTVRLRFSEPLLASSVTTSTFSVSGPSAVTVASVTLGEDEDEVEVALDEAVDAGEGTWTVAVSADVRDAAGNRLDGTWSGSAGAYAGYFGDLSATVDPVDGCSVATSTFVPDGDDGAGSEADQLEVALSSATEPTWWVATVWDEDGGVVVRDRVAPAGASDTWSWDGRGVDEAIVEAGTYTIEVDAGDGNGNRGGSCTASVTVAQHGGESTW